MRLVPWSGDLPFATRRFRAVLCARGVFCPRVPMSISSSPPSSWRSGREGLEPSSSPLDWRPLLEKLHARGRSFDPPASVCNPILSRNSRVVEEPDLTGGFLLFLLRRPAAASAVACIVPFVSAGLARRLQSGNVRPRHEKHAPRRLPLDPTRRRTGSGHRSSHATRHLWKRWPLVMEPRRFVF